MCTLWHKHTHTRAYTQTQFSKRMQSNTWTHGLFRNVKHGDSSAHFRTGELPQSKLHRHMWWNISNYNSFSGAQTSIDTEQFSSSQSCGINNSVCCVTVLLWAPTAEYNVIQWSCNKSVVDGWKTTQDKRLYIDPVAHHKYVWSKEKAKKNNNTGSKLFIATE